MIRLPRRCRTTKAHPWVRGERPVPPVRGGRILDWNFHEIGRGKRGNMTIQKDLFGPSDHLPARTTDPLPSKAAAVIVEAKGTARTHRRAILHAISRHPARNGREIAEIIGMEAYAVSKRLSELYQRGLIEHGMVTERARRWFATKKGVTALGEDRFHD